MCISKNYCTSGINSAAIKWIDVELHARILYYLDYLCCKLSFSQS